MIRLAAAVSLLVLGSIGCDSANHVITALDGTSDSTYWFWARLQGIQWHGNREITALTEANAAAARASDIDGVANGFSALSQKHSHLATQLTALIADDVDEIALEYRQRLVAAHTALSAASDVHASATRSRDMQALSEEKASLRDLLTDYVQLCNERNAIMSTLNARYDRDFDVAQ